MTPAARAAAAIDVLDEILTGEAAEKCLSRWGRGNRYAGSKDRAAVRDHVFDVLRQKRSLAAIGGGMSGRALILGLIRDQGIDVEDIFGAGGYGPDALTEAEMALSLPPQTDAERYDFPDWLWDVWQRNLGTQAIAAAQILQKRGPVTLRVNLRRGSLAQAQAVLAEDGIETTPVGNMNCALQVFENARRVHVSAAYEKGLIELQDLASQEAVAALDVPQGARVLDYCAGGGGKALALADMYECKVFAHDISAARTVDIAPRAARAGVEITVLPTADIPSQAPFNVVFVDAPCSGSGTWRRVPEAKWAMSEDKLFKYSILQFEVIAGAARFVDRGGCLVYATCSVFEVENGEVIDAFLQGNRGWTRGKTKQRIPDEHGDGFYYAVLKRS